MSRDKAILRHHNDWIALAEPSGPFLSLKVLQKVFPEGLPKERDESDLIDRLRDAYAEWRRAMAKRTPDSQTHRLWIEFVLTQLLGWPRDLIVEGQSLPPDLILRVPAEGVTIPARCALLDPDTRKPVIAVLEAPPGHKLNSSAGVRAWRGSALTRTMELLHAARLPIGLVTNGEEWTLVFARPGEPTGFAHWFAEYWIEERLTLRSFRALFSQRALNGADPAQRVDRLLIDSTTDQQEVTDRLGRQVRTAVEVLIQRLDRINRAGGERNAPLLDHVPEAKLYEAALAVMMRLVFLFAAEERRLLLPDNPLWDAGYSVLTLGAQLREEADRKGEEILERRSDAWARLLATFRAVHGGSGHDRMRLRAYGGALFDPDRYPFLEGRGPHTSWKRVEAENIGVDNRTVLHLLEALQYLHMPVPGGGRDLRRLSFRTLDIEQIGHVYEGLLDHACRRAGEPMLGLKAKGEETVFLRLAELESLAGKTDRLVKRLDEVTKRGVATLRRAVTATPTLDVVPRLMAACEGDAALVRRVQPFVVLLATDTRGDPVVILPRGLYVGPGDDRRSSGTHYTPRALTEELVRHTLDPLLYEGFADGVPAGPDTLVAPEKILELRVVDFACGSGAFLVQACRHLAERLMEAWERREATSPGTPLTVPEASASAGDPAERLVPTDPEERAAVARRLVVERCLYGVDRNELAVDMAKLSLWLITMERNYAFEFLDHALRVGDSLLGVTSAKQLEFFHLDPEAGWTLRDIADLYGDIPRIVRKALDDAAERRRELEGFLVRDRVDADRKAELLAAAEAATADLRLAGDVLVGCALASTKDARALDGQKRHWEQGAKTKKANREDAFAHLLRTVEEDVALLLRADTGDGPRRAARNRLKAFADEHLNLLKPDSQPKRLPFHWAIEFPEVMARGGFDALLGNPPFKGGQHLTGLLGEDYRDVLVQWIAAGRRGSADLSVYFLLRAEQVVRDGGGMFGLLATQTITEGDSREVGLDAMLEGAS